MGNPLFSVVPSFMPLLLVNFIDYVVGVISRLEDSIFLVLSAITISIEEYDG